MGPSDAALDPPDGGYGFDLTLQHFCTINYKKVRQQPFMV